MALHRILDFQNIATLAPGATAQRTADISGMPSGRFLAAMWIYADMLLTRGVGAADHEPQEVAQFVQSILGTVGRHMWGITDGRDLYSYQEIARGKIYAGNPRLTLAATEYRIKFRIPTTYILDGGAAERNTRPPCEEFEGGTLNFSFLNPFVATDVDDIQVNNFNLWAEHYPRGEKKKEIEPGKYALAPWGGFWASRTPPQGQQFKITDMIPNMVLLKDRGWATMQCQSKTFSPYTNLLPEQMVMLDSDRFDNFEVDPVLTYALGAVETDALRILSDIPLVGGTEDWSKLLDGRNERDAEPPIIFTADAAYDFSASGAVIVGRRAVVQDQMVNG